MNAFGVISLFAFFACFLAAYVYASNSGSFYPPLPYSFVAGDVASAFSAFLFVFVFSLLFFGMSAPIAMGLEGAKYGALLALGSLKLFDLALVVPLFFAALSATVLGQGVISDYRGGRSIFEFWDEAVGYLILGVVSLVLVVVFRPLVIGFF